MVAQATDVVFEFGLAVPRFAKNDGKKFRLRAVLFSSELIRRYASIAKRNYVAALGLPDRSLRTVRYFAPKGYKFTDIPKSANVENKWGKYSITYHLEKDDELRVEFIREMRKWRLQPENYPEFRKYCQEVERIENHEIIIEKK